MISILDVTPAWRPAAQVPDAVFAEMRRLGLKPIGLYDLDRRPQPVAAAYRQIIREFGAQRPGSNGG
jgi:hypothetical protein